MIEIEIDQEVFNLLQNNAKPLIDTPNTVIRRLLGLDKKLKPEKIDQPLSVIRESKTSGVADQSSHQFVLKVLKREFAEDFRVKSPYRLMYESSYYLIYFQNFNQQSTNLWYRITKKPLQVLKSSKKNCFICFTNPADQIAYLIPLEDINKEIAASKWSRDYLEVNIDPISHKWRELEWRINRYLKKYS